MEALVVCTLGAYLGLRFLIPKDRRKDQVSFYWYNVRLFSSVVYVQSNLDFLDLAVRRKLFGWDLALEAV